MLIFKYNRCGNLLDPISLYPTLDALGSLKAQISQGSRTDIDAIRFIEDMGCLVTQLLSDPNIESLGDTEISEISSQNMAFNRWTGV
jgi:hypothetical protein